MFLSKPFRLSFLLVMLSVLFMTVGLAEDFNRPLLFVSLPEDAQMIEDVHFEDGDFIQTYQLGGGAHITLLRYANFDMTLPELISSEWEGAGSVSTLNLEPISGQQTDAIRFSYTDSDSQTYLITLVAVRSGKDTLVFESVFPSRNGEEQVNALVDQMVQSMSVINMSESNLG
ncbi:MAG: hypothetical protein IJ088_11965 [Clostridia bacterium]|nr:hypothetical protein [Clostridia bacterium]